MNFTSDFLLVLIFKGSWEPQCPGAPEPREPWEPREPREPQTMNWNFAVSIILDHDTCMYDAYIFPDTRDYDAHMYDAFIHEA